MIAVFLALSQFIEPYSDQQIKAFTEARKASGEPLQQWELSAYTFKPIAPENIITLTSDKEDLARYLRATCVRALSSTQTQRSIDKGKLRALDFDLIANASIQDETIQKYQERIIGKEQGIRLTEAKEIVKTICDQEKEGRNYLAKLMELDLNSAVTYYLKIQKSLPSLKSSKDLPRLFEVSVVTDKKGKVIGDFSKNEVNKDLQVIRRHRRRLSQKPFPALLKKALVSIEDARFWNFQPKGSKDYQGHRGVDFKGMLRALQSTGAGDLQGGSTITMQLAKNLILYEDVFNENNQRKRSLLRKLKEYILVERLEKILTKDQILDLYLNTIDFGRNTQGAVVASWSYFGKPVERLNLEELAFLAGLPKAPNKLDPEKNLEAALKRRNKVINDMKKNKFITSAQKKEAKAKSISFVGKKKDSQEQGYASFYVSAVQNQLKEWKTLSGKDPDQSFNVVTPINHEYQKWAVESLQRGLLRIERSKGTLTVKPSQDNLPNIKESVFILAQEKGEKDLNKIFSEVLSKVKNPYPDGGQFILGVILPKNKIGLPSGKIISRHKFDRKRLKNIDGKKRALELWDVVLLQKILEKGKAHHRIASYTDVQGAIVVLDNKTGEVLATSGGFSIGAGRRYQGPSGNRAFSAERQPGSTVKPFSYFNALMRGLSPSLNISNKAVTLPAKKYRGQKVCNKWTVRPNSQRFNSLTLRQGLEKSKNALTVNTFVRSFSNKVDALSTGIDQVLSRMQSFGLYQNVEQACYPILLGGQETRVVDIAGAYSAVANLGTYTKPHVIKSLTHRGKVIKPYGLKSNLNKVKTVQNLSDSKGRQQFNLFRLRSFLQGVVARGTARKIKEWSSIVAGKTGTTNNNKDAWFVGFNKDITVAVWVGYDRGRSLGSKYEGGVAALPIFKDFMDQFYKKHPEKLKNAFQDPKSGLIEHIEPFTGFRLDTKFQNDFEFFTGQKKRIAVQKEFFASAKELRASAGLYERGSKIAGEFFFNNMTKARKSLINKEFKDNRQVSEDRLNQYKRALKANQDYCDRYVKTHPNNVKVATACRRAKEYRSYIEKNKNGVSSLKNYFLKKNGFIN